MSAPESVTANFVRRAGDGFSDQPRLRQRTARRPCKKDRDRGKPYCEHGADRADYAVCHHGKSLAVQPWSRLSSQAPGGQSCTIAVLFTPSAIATDAATLNIVTSAPGSPIQIPITQRESRRSDGEWLGRFALVAVRSKMFRPRTRAARFGRGSGRVRVGDWETVQRHSLRARKNRQSSDPSRHNANLFKLDRKTFYANGEY